MRPYVDAGLTSTLDRHAAATEWRSMSEDIATHLIVQQIDGSDRPASLYLAATFDELDTP